MGEREGDVREVYAIYGPFSKNSFRNNVRSKGERLVTSQHDQLYWWEKHFQELLTRDTEEVAKDPLVQVNPRQEMEVELSLPTDIYNY